MRLRPWLLFAPCLAVAGCAAADPDATDLHCSLAAGQRLGSDGPVCFTVHAGRAIVDGDIDSGPAAELLEDATALQPQGLSASRESAVVLWPGGKIPYQVSSAFTSAQAQTIQSGIAHWNSFAAETGVTWTPKQTGTADYVLITPDTDPASVTHGSSAIGKAGGAQQLILNFPNMVLHDKNALGVVLHEMGHAAGLLHEHMREDRDQYVTIHTQNIVPQYGGQFTQVTGAKYDDIGPYDLASVMHYSWDNGSKQYGVLPTITKKDGSLYQSGGELGVLSQGDRATTEYLYRPIVSTTLPFSDDFSRPNDIILGSHWQNKTGKVDLVSGMAQNAALSYASVEVLGGVSTPAAAVEADLKASTSSAFSSVYVVARYSGPGDANHYYAGFIKAENTSGARLTLRKRIGETATELAGVDLPGVTSGRIRLEVSGVRLRVYRDQALVWNIADGTFTSGGVGIKLSGPARVDNFHANTLANPHVAHWKLDEGSGSTTAADATGNGRTAALSNVAFAKGVRGNAAYFNGLAQGTVANHASLNPGTSDFSVTGWIGTSNTSKRYVLSKRSSCNHGSFWNMLLNYVPGKLTVEVDGSSTGANHLLLTSNKTVSDNYWHHFAFVRQGTSLKLYVDGSLDASGTTSATTNVSNTANLLLGKSACTPSFLGWLDDVRYYSAALSAAEVNAVFKP